MKAILITGVVGFSGQIWWLSNWQWPLIVAAFALGLLAMDIARDIAGER